MGEFEFLQYKRYSKNLKGTYLVGENKNYVGQLIVYLNDCSSIEEKLEDTPYTQSALSKLFNAYYKCVNSEMSYSKTKDKTSTEFGMQLGASSTTMKFYGGNFKYLSQADYNYSLKMTGGVFLNLGLPRKQGRWMLRNELMLTSYSCVGTYEDVMNFSIITSNFSCTHLKLNNLFRYKRPVGSLFVFINGGISNGVAIKGSNSKSKDFYLADRVEESPALQETKKHELGYILGAGLNYNNYSLEARVEIGNGVSTLQTLASKTIRYNLLLAYTF
jgi:hypothetical protein